jgi:hypothetical protein
MTSCLNKKHVSNSPPINDIVAQISGTGSTKSTFTDDVFRIENITDTSKKIALNASAISTGTTRTLTVPDTSMTLIGRNSKSLDRTSLDINTSGAYNYINLEAATGTDTYLRFLQSGASPRGQSGITFSDRDGDTNFHIHTRTTDLRFTFTPSLPTANLSEGNSILSIDTTNKRVRFHNYTDDSKIAEFDVSGITGSTTRTFALPDASGTILLEDNSTTVSNKTIDDSNDVADGALSDNVFRRSGSTWVADTFATGESGDLKTLSVSPTGGVDRFLRFPPGTGCLYSNPSNRHNFYVYGKSNRLNISYTDPASETADDYGTVLFSFHRQASASDHALEVYHQSNGFAVRLFPNDITSNRNIRFPNASGTLALADDLPSTITSGTWLPTVSNIQGFTGSTTSLLGQWFRIGDIVQGTFRIISFSMNSSFNQIHSFEFTTPVSQTFANKDRLNGFGAITYSQSPEAERQAGVVNAVATTNRGFFSCVNELVINSDCEVTVTFTYEIL